MAKTKDFDKAEMELREFGFTYPEVTEDFPWGHRTLKVKGKAFIFMAREGTRFSLSVKLPFSAPAALALKNVEPTAYGMAKHNWVTAAWEKGETVDTSIIRSWMDESYRAVAPKTVLKMLDAGAKNTAPASSPETKRGESSSRPGKTKSRSR